MGSNPIPSASKINLKEENDMKDSKSTSLKNCELVFNDDGIVVVEHAKDDDKEFLLEDILRKYEGVSTLSIKISFDKEI